MEVTKKITEDLSRERFDKACAIIFQDYSRSQLKKWIIEGRVLLNNEIASPKETVTIDDEISLNPVSEKKIEWEPQNINFEVIHENEDYLIINKPSNLVIHPGSGCHDGTLANGLLFKFPELNTIPRAGIVHRLDKDTSGILLIARTEKFRNYFVNLLQERKVKKIYKAIIVGKIIGSFEINEPIGRDKTNRIKMSIRPDGKEAISFIKPCENLGNYSMVDVLIETGRTHQIRVHLACKKLPIIGDKTYNSAGNIAKDTSQELIDSIRSFPRQALHSFNLAFKDMYSDKIISFESDIPNDMKTLVNTIKKHI